VLGSVEGRIAGGVCFARWKPPDGFDPFDVDKWAPVHEVDLDDPQAPFGSVEFIERLKALPARQPPIYSIESEERWAFSTPPGKRLNRLRFSTEQGVTSLHGRAQQPIERWVEFDAELVSGKTTLWRVRAPDDLDVVTVLLDGRTAEVQGEEASDG
jgi:hypothetical protein